MGGIRDSTIRPNMSILLSGGREGYSTQVKFVLKGRQGERKFTKGGTNEKESQEWGRASARET